MLKSQVTTQMFFTSPRAALSRYTVGIAGLLFLPTTNSCTCSIRSPCSPNRTEYKANTDSKTLQQLSLNYSLCRLLSLDTEPSQQVTMSQHKNNLLVCREYSAGSLATDVEEMLVQKFRECLWMLCHLLCKNYRSTKVRQNFPPGLRLVLVYNTPCYLLLPVIQYSVVCHFQLKQRKWHYCNLGSASCLSSETRFKKKPYYIFCLPSEQKQNLWTYSELPKSVSWSLPLLVLPSNSYFRGVTSLKEPLLCSHNFKHWSPDSI